MYVSTIPERNGVSNLNTCIVVVIVIYRSSQTRSVSVLLGTLTWVFAWFTTEPIRRHDVHALCFLNNVHH